MKLKIAIVSLFALGAAALTAFSQTNISLSGTQPYYSISNVWLSGSGTILANDTLAGFSTNNYANAAGTNYSGGTIQPFGVSRSRYVAFGLTVTTTNTAGVAFTAVFQGSTGGGDWTTLTNLVATTVAAGAAGGTNQAYANGTVDSGGLILFRVKSIGSAEAATTNATVTASFASKAGI